MTSVTPHSPLPAPQSLGSILGKLQMYYFPWIESNNRRVVFSLLPPPTTPPSPLLQWQGSNQQGKKQQGRMSGIMPLSPTTPSFLMPFAPACDCTASTCLSCHLCCPPIPSACLPLLLELHACFQALSPLLPMPEPQSFAPLSAFPPHYPIQQFWLWIQPEAQSAQCHEPQPGRGSSSRSSPGSRLGPELELLQFLYAPPG